MVELALLQYVQKKDLMSKDFFTKFLLDIKFPFSRFNYVMLHVSDYGLGRDCGRSNNE